MCIKIVRTKEELVYDSSKPIEEQIRGAKQIVINYEPSDPDLNRFLDEVERLCKTGVSAQMNIKVVHNDYLNGAKTKKEILHMVNDLKFNEVIKAMVKGQHETDKRLEELLNLCRVSK